MHRRYVDCSHALRLYLRLSGFTKTQLRYVRLVTLTTVVVKNCQGYTKYNNRHADLKF